MFALRDYQQEAVSKTFEFLQKNPDGHPLIASPTGSGKTVILAGLIEQTLNKWPNTKILVISHVKEILEQDYAALNKHLNIDIGLYSAGLDSRTIRQVTVAGIQSIYKKTNLFDSFDLIIIDECHLIPLDGAGMYRTLFNGLGKVRYLGLTATPYRLGGGLIYGEDRLFTGVSFDLTSMKRFNKLVEDGYLSKLKTIATNIELDVTGIKTQNGDFAKTDMSSAFDREPITNAAIDEIIRVGADYKKWLIFAIDIDHAEHIAETLIRKGVPTSVIHSKMDEDRDHILKRSKEGFFKALVNVNVLTTGYDDPEIDLIAILRPTKSPVIHVQTIGRGLRVMPGKDHCVVLDFAGNTERLGPINSMTVKEKRKGKGGEPITKRCPTCDTIHHPAVRKCEFCGWEFEFKHGLGNSSGNDVVASDRPLWHKVDEISYYKHEKPNRPPMVKVAYKCGLQFYNEFVCPEHPGWAGMRGRNWIEYRGGKGFTVDEAMKEAEGYKRPNKILVNTKTKYPSIDDYSF